MEPTIVAPSLDESAVGDNLVRIAIRRIDEVLEVTKQRQVFTCSEVQDFCLDLRSILREAIPAEA